MAVTYMDSILVQIPTLEVNSLLQIYDHFSIKISEEKKTMRTVVAALFMTFITKGLVISMTGYRVGGFFKGYGNLA